MKQEEITGSDMSQAAKTNGKWIAKESRAAAQQAEGLLDQATEMATQAYDTVRESSVDLFDNVSSSTTKFVKKYPLETAAGALCVGLLVGAFAFRRSK